MDLFYRYLGTYCYVVSYRLRHTYLVASYYVSYCLRLMHASYLFGEMKNSLPTACFIVHARLPSTINCIIVKTAALQSRYLLTDSLSTYQLRDKST